MMGSYKFMKPLGVIVSVDGDISQVGMYNMSNDASFLWDGDILVGPQVGAFLTIEQNGVHIITTVISEKIMDQQNTVKSEQFDNRYKKDSINRIILLKTQGVIENGNFQLTSQYVPMVGNKVVLTSKIDLDAIYDIDDGEATICIGKSAREKRPVSLPINKFFASHIGIFGNTGSGKSNTLHKLYLELFHSEFEDQIYKKSKFFVIDFNDEYTQPGQFGVKEDHKKVWQINTSNPGKGDKIPVTEEYLFNPDILAILFNARPATQVPFLRNSIKEFLKIEQINDFSELELGLLKKLLLDYKEVGYEPIENWVKVTKDFGAKSKLLNKILNGTKVTNYAKLEIYFKNKQNKIIYDGEFCSLEATNLQNLCDELENLYDNKNEIERLKFFLEYQKIYVSAWKSTNLEHINPLFNRLRVALDSIESIVEVVPSIKNKFKCLNIFSLVHANQDVKRLIPMMISKMVYDDQKEVVSNTKQITQTCHLIIDEAHNILNSEEKRNGDSWQDFRLSVFEEIIKEGRKFGFFLTISSQRPADISPTIISQLHNFFVHRLVNENDLRMLENTMPTLDKNSYNEISSLGQGEAIITGNAMKVPMLVKVDKEKSIRPKSDDIILTDLWTSDVSITP